MSQRHAIANKTPSAPKLGYTDYSKWIFLAITLILTAFVVRYFVIPRFWPNPNTPGAVAEAFVTAAVAHDEPHMRALSVPAAYNQIRVGAEQLAALQFQQPLTWGFGRNDVGQLEASAQLNGAGRVVVLELNPNENTYQISRIGLSD